MTLSSLKIVLINFSTLAFSMTSIDMILKISLLIITIVYTLNKWWVEREARKNNKKNK
jgi:energy-converting hydrogenase Eha subunit H